ncbi:MAG: restriction endonuclease subunit S [Oscillospiraceae bacterium]
MNLTDREWKEFYIGGHSGIFSVKSTTSGIDKNKLNVAQGKTPYITRTDKSNGIDLFVSEIQNEKYIIDAGNIISIGLDTQTVFYQPYEFYTGQNIQVLSNKNINKHNAQFICNLLKLQLQKFNWGGNGATLGRLVRTKIMLPVNIEGNPDYVFMEAYVKEEERCKKEKYIVYATKMLEKLEYVEVPTLEEKEWKPFAINELFEKIDAGKGKGLNHLSKVDNNGVNYIGATHRNNGVLCQIGIEDTSSKMIQQGNCIGFIRNGNGSVGYAVYKAEHFVSTSDVSLAYSQTMNRYIGLFIVTSSNLIRGKYNHNYKRTPERLKKDGIMLPVSKTGIPDYLYMEQYAKNITINKLKKYLSFVGQEVN